jgi:hypothetical protein
MGINKTKMVLIVNKDKLKILYLIKTIPAVSAI